MLSRSRLRILLISKGGRESAIAWKLSQFTLVKKIFAVPGNRGTATGIDKISNVQDTSKDDYQSLVKIAEELKINLIVPGLDVLVVGGIKGYFCAGTYFPVLLLKIETDLLVVNILCFALFKETIQLKGSKAFSKDFIARYCILTTKYQNFTEYNSAKAYIESISHKVVIKASGLAAGKGVVFPKTPKETLKTLKNIMLDRKFGAADAEVVIKEFLEKNKLSILIFSDKTTFKSMLPA
jgi:phosphoribosylamine--glycine ligase/phosphoribosylformylglycinamidine cyclo-ligase